MMANFTQDELKYAKKFAQYYKRLGENMKLKDWEELQEFREPLGIDLRRSNQIVEYVKEHWDEFSEKKEKGQDKQETTTTPKHVTVRSSRRAQVQQEMGIQQIDQQQELAKSLAKEEERKRKKEARQKEIEESTSYKMTKGVATAMDKYFLDAIMGLIPGVGDFLPSVCILPSIYVSLVKVKSIPLTLACIFNILKDIVIGMIPFYIGAVLDFVNRAYIQNLRLIVGFVEDDKEIIEEVNRKAVWSAILIAIFIGLIYLMVTLVASAIEGIGNFFSNLF